MNQVTKPQGGGLPAGFLDKLSSGIAESRATTVLASGGKPLLRLLKSGDWLYGADNVDVEEGSRWQINIYTLAHGWSCWVETAPGQKNELRGEIMVSMTDPKPERPPAISGTEYSEQRSFDLKCVSGEDTGTEVTYKTTSVGGMRGVDGLLKAIHTKLAENPAFPCPVLELGSDHYDHTKYGRTYVPIFNIVGWANMDGVMETEANKLLPQTTASVPEPEPAPRRRTRAAAAEPAKAPEPEAPPVSTTQAHATQRRRPGR